MHNIILKLVDENKSNKIKFSQDTIILNKSNPSVTFNISITEGWQLEDILYIGKSYQIINHNNNTITAKLKDNISLDQTNTWFINFLVEKK